MSLNSLKALHFAQNFVKTFSRAACNSATALWSTPLGRISTIATITIGTVVGSLAIYQFVATKIDEKRFPFPGKRVDVGGYKLHIYCTGPTNNKDAADKPSENKKPTVILDSGMGQDSIGWSLVQPEIAKFAHVCSYDRGGYGWSDESPKPRTCKEIVKELHTLLIKAHITPPYILVGHSFGGLNMQLYAKKYPSEVSGLVLVDSAHEKNLEKLPKEPKTLRTSLQFNLLITRLGITRLFLQLPSSKQSVKILPENAQRPMLAHLSSTKQVKATFKEWSSFKENLAELEEAHLTFGNLPLTVISAGQGPSSDGMSKEWKEYVQKFYPAWMVLQKDLASRSSKGKLIIAEKSGHMIPFSQPDLIVEAVKEIVEDLNKKN